MIATATEIWYYIKGYSQFADTVRRTVKYGKKRNHGTGERNVFG